MGGNLLDQPLPIWGIDQIDPFLLIHHWDEPVPKGKKQEAIRRWTTSTQRFFSCHLYIQRKLKSSRFHWEPQRSWSWRNAMDACRKRHHP